MLKLIAQISKGDYKMAHKVLCGVPKGHCQGGRTTVNHNDAAKAHGSHSEAFRCMAHYLVKILGYTRIGSREFINPNDGYVNVLTKKSRYGILLRRGKSAEGMSSKRFTYKRHCGGAIGDGIAV